MQRFHRSLGLELLDCSKNRVQHNHAEYDSGVHKVPRYRGHCRRPQKEVYEGVMQLARSHSGDAGPFFGLKRVWPEALDAVGYLRIVKAGIAGRPEPKFSV